MKHFILALVLSSLLPVSLIAQSDDMIYRYFIKGDSTYIMADNSKNNWFTLEFKADTLIQNEDQLILFDDKLLQINVIPFSKIIPNTRKSVTIPKALQAYKKWELDYLQEELKTKLKNGEEFYYRDGKPFLIWWYKNPPEGKIKSLEINEKESEFETSDFRETKTLHVTHMLYLNFAIYGAKNVALAIPVLEDANLEEEIDKLKTVANSLRVYGGNIDLDVLVDKMHLKENYVVRDSLNSIELEVPNWLNVIEPPYKKTFSATFPEIHEVVNAMILKWEYTSVSSSFEDFINSGKVPHEERPNYKLIERNDSTLKYFYTSENGWFHQQNVYLKGDSIYCFINFTATRNTYDYNIGRFEEILKSLRLK